MTFEIENVYPEVVLPDYETVIKNVIEAALDYEKCPYEAQVYVLLTDNEEIHQINREHRQIDRPTDVLSFPMADYPVPGDFSDIEERDPDAFHPETGELMLGDIIISMDKVKERLQVREYREMKVTEVKNLRLPETLVPIPEDINEIQQLTLFNEMCRKVRRFQEAELKQLAAAVQFTGLINFSDVAYIATHLNEFEINPTVHNDEEYGKYLITESGLFEVDELLLPHINYAAFGADKKAGTFEVSGYVDDGFVGVTRPIEEYSQYKGEFADPLEITEEGLEKFCLFSPLIANLNMRGIAEGELYGSDLVQYLEIIEEAIEREKCEGEEARGLMHYFDESREVAAKVVSAHPKVADVDGELYGVLECKIRDPLTEEEIKILKDFWTGQMSDGWGEGFEQQPLIVEDGEIYISFWSRKSFWSVMTERELIGKQQVQNTETQMHM